MNQPAPIVYAFIDSQNLNLGISHNVIHPKTHQLVHKGWALDFEKFRKFLKDKYKVSRAFLFIGHKPGNESLYEYLHEIGYSVVLKPTTTYVDGKGETIVKGNVDTDLVLYAAKEMPNYDKAVLVTGDGDFLSLCEYLDQSGKLGTILIPNKYKFSQLLNEYVNKLDFVSVNSKKLAKK
jgi:uncharacterized LabA/DUF88 family protein